MQNTFLIAILYDCCDNHIYHAQIVAKLPFEPFSLLQSMTHTRTSGNGSTDCSMNFIYVLPSYIIRADFHKYFQLSPKISCSI